MNNTSTWSWADRAARVHLRTYAIAWPYKADKGVAWKLERRLQATSHHHQQGQGQVTRCIQLRLPHIHKCIASPLHVLWPPSQSVHSNNLTHKMWNVCVVVYVKLSVHKAWHCRFSVWFKSNTRFLHTDHPHKQMHGGLDATCAKAMPWNPTV